MRAASAAATAPRGALGAPGAPPGLRAGPPAHDAHARPPARPAPPEIGVGTSAASARTSSSTTATEPGAFSEDDARRAARCAGPGGVRMTVGLPTPRCVVRPARTELPADPQVLRTLATDHRIALGRFGNQPCAGAYAEVDRAGALAVGEVLVVGEADDRAGRRRCARPSAASRRGSRRDRAAAGARRGLRLRAQGGDGYAGVRRTDPRIAALCARGARLRREPCLNVGAGAGSYEPRGPLRGGRSSPRPPCGPSGRRVSRPSIDAYGGEAAVRRPELRRRDGDDLPCISGPTPPRGG